MNKFKTMETETTKQPTQTQGSVGRSGNRSINRINSTDFKETTPESSTNNQQNNTDAPKIEKPQTLIEGIPPVNNKHQVEVEPQVEQKPFERTPDVKPQTVIKGIPPVNNKPHVEVEPQVEHKPVVGRKHKHKNVGRTPDVKVEHKPNEVEHKPVERTLVDVEPQVEHSREDTLEDTDNHHVVTHTGVVESNGDVIEPGRHEDGTEFVWKYANSDANVRLAGSWNGWTDQVPLEYNHNEGRFSGRVNLVKGTYTYKFIVNGEWVIDLEKPTSHDSGHSNNVITV